MSQPSRASRRAMAEPAKTIEFIKSIKPAQIDGTEDKEIGIKFASGERKFTGQSLLLNFCLPNFYFHATTAYDILRHCGSAAGRRRASISASTSIAADRRAAGVIRARC